MNSEVDGILRSLFIQGYRYSMEAHPFIKNLYKVKWGANQVYSGSYNMCIAYLNGILSGLALNDERHPFEFEG